MHAPAEPALAALQLRMAAALLAADAGRQELPEELFAGAYPGAEGLRVHRNTMLGAIANALRMSFVAVERLVGAAFFDRMAVAYIRAAPPHVPQLDEYGRGFAEFIADFPGTASLPYLCDLARFEWQLAELGRLRRAAQGGALLLLDGGVRLHFAAPLRTHAAAYAVDQLRAAILAEDIDTLRAVGAQTGVYGYALWRTDEGVKARSLSAASVRFLGAALAGADGAHALAAAAAGEQGAQQVAEILAREILPASFVRVEAVNA